MKQQLVLWGRPSEHPGRFGARILNDLGPALLELGEFSLKVTFTGERPPRLALFPFSRRPLALFSLAGADLPDPVECDRLLRLQGERVAAYQVDESVPRQYRRDWPDGEPTPGAGLLTLFRRRPGLDDAEFIRRWHGVHTPLTLRTHPVWCYVRNVVAARLLPGSPPFDAIVEEHFQDREELLNPMRFYGGTLALLPNMVRVGVDIAGFIDLFSLETYLVSEAHLRS